MAGQSDAYRPRRPGAGALYRVVREHLETFCAQAASLRGGEGLPRFVEEEFRAYLRCGWLAAGFARFRCAACGTDRLVAFSCKGRGFCPSCGARRMTALTVHLTDDVFPAVPVRQWVLSLPHRVRYLLAWDHDLCRAVVGVFLRAVLGFLRDGARARGSVGGRSGAVAVVQRFGAALNLNVHVHALVLDGVFTRDATGALTFHEAEPPSDEEVGRVLETVGRRVERLLDRRGHGLDEDGFAPDHWAEDAPALASMAAAAVLSRAASGPRAGARLRRWADSRDGGQGEPVRAPRCHAHREGFDLHAGIVAPAGHTRRLERLCRYALRPPVAEERLQVTSDEHVVLRLRHRWSDGTTHVLFEPTEFLERLAVITPRPRINLVLYYGLLAPRSSWRNAIVRAGGRRCDRTAARSPGGAASASDPPTASWAALMRRTFGFDVLACPRCGHGMRLIALIERPEVIRRILRHLGHPLEVPPPAPARAPPFSDDADAGCSALRLPFADEAEWAPAEEEPC
ncbi:MAG: transposase [Euryarchaeota archaeon]|nr:transposase [Euryarchaeota archaeon]